MRRLFSSAPLLLPSVFCLLIFLLPGCGKKETPVEAGNRDAILHIGNGAEPRDLDPNIATSITDSNIVTELFQGLVTVAADGRTIHPGAAESWEISPDGKLYTFHLRAGLKWSNGDPLTADDFLYSFRRIVEPKLASEMAVYTQWVVGAQNYLDGKTTDLSTVGFRAPDARTFEITLTERAPFWLTLMALNPFYPVNRASLEKVNGYLRRGAEWTRPGNLVSNGPFRLKDWRVNESVTLEKNSNYWDAAHVRLNGIVYHPIDDPGAEERAFRGGLLHVTRSVPISRLQEYRQQHSPSLCVDPVVSTKFVMFNVGRAPFDDPTVRAAFAHALDREALVRDVRRDGSRVANSFCVPGSGPSPGYVPRELLQHTAVVPLRKDLPPISLVFTPSRQGDQQLCEAMQAMWEAQLGVRVALDPQEEKVWMDTRTNKNFQMFLMTWADINDPVALLQIFLGSSPLNSSNWASPEFDREFAAAGQSTTDEERWAHLQNADALLITAFPLIPLYHENLNYLLQPSLHGWEGNALGTHMLTDAYLEAR